jgi:hypothetical protein
MVFKQLGTLLLAFIFISSCAVDPKKETLVNYVNHDILSIAQIELEAFERYAAVTGKNYTTDQAVYNALQDEVIPVYKRFLHLLNRVRLEDDEVARAHGFYLKGSKKILRGFELKLYGIADKDDTVTLLGNKKIDEGIRDTLKWREQILALKESRGLLDMNRKKSKLEAFLYSMDEKLLEAGPTGN